MTMKSLVVVVCLLSASFAQSATPNPSYETTQALTALKQKHDFYKALINSKEQEVRDLSIILDKGRHVAKLETRTLTVGLAATAVAAAFGAGLGLAGSIADAMFFLSLPATGDGGAALTVTAAVMAIGGTVVGLPASYVTTRYADFLATSPNVRDVHQAQIFSDLVMLSRLKEVDDQIDQSEPKEDSFLVDSVKNSLTLGWYHVAYVQRMVDREQQHIMVYKAMNALNEQITDELSQVP